MKKRSAHEELQQRLEACLKGVDAADEGALTAAWKDFRRRSLEIADKEFGPGQCGVPCSQFICEACDILVRQVVGALPAGSAKNRDDLRVSWVAIGGYGRGLMSPASTVRLVLLHDDQDPRAIREKAQRAVQLLGRSGTDAVSVVHTVAEGIRRMRDDPVAAISMLDTRLVAGNEGLHAQFEDAANQDFLIPNWGRFGEEALREALSRRDPFTGSPYSTEPNLKDGAGGLRDIGTAQKVGTCLTDIPGLERFHEALAGSEGALLKPQELERLQEALDFILRVRNRLHFLQEERSDVLHRAAHVEMALALGFRDAAGEAARMDLMRELFRHTGYVARLLRALQERFQHIYRVGWRGAAPLAWRDLGDGFVAVEGKVRSSAHPPFEKGKTAARLMRLFRLSQRRHLPVSQELLDQVTAHLSLVDEAFRADNDVGAVFVDLLAGSVGVADRIRWMIDCGLLQAYLPEFAPIVHRIDYASTSDHTQDEHAIEAIRVVDELGHTSERAELAQREALEQVERPDLLRLAILLHDLDAVSEAPSLKLSALTERIGLRSQEREDLEFLLRNRRILWHHTESRTFQDRSARRELASSVGSAERLRMLYLMTYAHARAMGPAGWFAWRDAHLYELYQTLMAELVPDYTPFATAEYFAREFEELAQRHNLAEAARQFLPLLPDLYKAEVSPGEALAHLGLVRKTGTQPAAMSWTVGTQDATVWTCTSDVPARFSQIAAIFTYNGLDITSATAFTLTDGTVLDRFVVHMKGRPINPDPSYWQKIESDLVLSIEGKLDAGRAVKEKAASGAREQGVSSRRATTTVHFDNDSTSRFTILDIVARDRVGLLFDIARTLSAMQLNIELARIRTRGDLAQDVFFVTDSLTGQQVTSKARLAEVRERLVEAAAPAPGSSPE